MAREKFPSDDAERLMLRFPAGMRDRIAEAAKANNRSMNAEIVSRLESSFDFMGDLSVAVAAERMTAMIRTSAASAVLDALAAANQAWKEGGPDQSGEQVYDRLAVRLNELLEMKMSDLHLSRIQPTKPD